MNTFDHRMPRALHVALCNHLLTTLEPGECDNTHRHTRTFLIDRGTPVDPAVEWLKEHGGCCDCEVILNTIPWDTDEMETAH